jgi:hypothetical protein
LKTEPCTCRAQFFIFGRKYLLYTLLKKISDRFFNPTRGPVLDKEYLNYAAYAYPSNHAYKIKGGKLLPKRQLDQRYKKIEKLFPHPLTSFADISCSKGFFVFAASNHDSCTRSLGIDINTNDINFCHKLKEYLGKQQAQFALLRLHQLAEQIDAFGGAFQTVLLLNSYQYLYFGSEYYPQSYLDHDVIFKNLSLICSHRLIFSNRVNIKDVQVNPTVLKSESHYADYTEENIIKAAEKYFTVKPIDFIGRYPLWVLDRKGVK